jgi:hypothetical protein
MAWTAAVLVPALILNPAQLEWWFAAKQSWRDLLLYRLLGGGVTLGAVLLGMGRIPGLPAGGLPAAAAAYSAGFAAAALYLMARAGHAGGARLPRMFPVTARMRYLWRQSFPIALTVVCDFLFVALGYYAFTAAGESGPLLGAYACAYRVILAASMFSSSLFTVLLPRFAGHSDLANALRRVFDRMALSLAALLPAVPFLARPLLRLFFPKAGWDAASLDYAAWALSTMGLATYLHLLRMPPLTKALSEGSVWLYCRRFFLAGAANVVVVAAGVFSGFARGLPLLALTADIIFTAWWLSDLYPQGGKARWGRLGALLSGSLAYLAWVGYWV